MILPLLLLLIFGIIEVGRLLAIFSSVSSAARQSARYGSVGGDSGHGMPYYLDCAGMRQKAKDTSLLQPLADSDISINYDLGLLTQTIGSCATAGLTPSLSEPIKDGDRVVISITTTYRPIVPIVPLPTIPMGFVAAHTIFTTIIGPTPTPIPNPDLALTKTGSPNPVQPGSSSLTYEMLVTNTGAIAASNVIVSDTLPASINPSSVILPPLPSSPAAGWTCGRANLVVTCTLPFLGSLNAAPPIDLHVTAPITPGVITNVASVANDLSDPNLSNNTATVTTTVLTAIDLQLTKVSLVDTVGAGTPVTYVITLQNNGSVAATTQIVTDTLPANTSLISAAGDSTWTCAQNAGAVICSRNPGNPLPVGGTAPTITVVLRAPMPGFVPPSGVITNSVSASSQLFDPFPNNSTNVVATTTVTTDADLAMFKFGPSNAESGNVYPYTLRVTNNGPSIATGVRIVDTVPIAIQSLTPGAGWTCNPSGTTVTCTYGQNLDAGATTSDVTINVTAPDQNVNLVNSATASSDEPDPHMLNNTAVVTTTVSNCRQSEVSPSTSTVSASPTNVSADNSSTALVLVTLKDACSNVLVSPPYDPQQVTPTSSRGGLDTITLAPGYNNPTSNGQVAFLVKSGTPGTSTYTFTVRNANNGATVNLTATAQVNFYGCVSLSAGVPGSNTELPFNVTNNSSFARRLTSVNLTWPANGKVISLKLQSTTLWSKSGGYNKSPLSIPSLFPWDATGTNAARTINSGSTQTLLFSFSGAAVSGDYGVTTTWDDGSGGRVCTVTKNVSE